MVLRRHEEEGLGRVEGNALDASAVLLEGVLGAPFGELMDQNGLCKERNDLRVGREWKVHASDDNTSTLEILLGKAN